MKRNRNRKDAGAKLPELDLSGGRIKSQVADESIMSSWWRLFADWPEKMAKEWKRDDLTISVACFLDDGSVIEGVARDFNDQSEETGDRDLILGGPIRRIAPDGVRQVLDSEVACVSARNIKLLAVAYSYPSDESSGDDVVDPRALVAAVERRMPDAPTGDVLISTQDEPHSPPPPAEICSCQK